MTESISSKKSALMDDKIDQFCQSSAELLESIHARCGTIEPKKPKQKRKKRQRKNPA
jgi:hypothetical protein